MKQTYLFTTVLSLCASACVVTTEPTRRVEPLQQGVESLARGSEAQANSQSPVAAGDEVLVDPVPEPWRGSGGEASVDPVPEPWRGSGGEASVDPVPEPWREGGGGTPDPRATTNPVSNAAPASNTK